ncbi:MAG: hypothetical protein M4579_005532 [Chaenotheca gracillima]|nr:MAG: hypothetical protein M4579_005532 [Chaenotheca gracillima]
MEASSMKMEASPQPTTTSAAGAAQVPQSYFAFPPHAGLMYAHIALMVMGWVFVLPVGVVLSIAQSRFTMFVQLSFLVLNGLGVAVGTVYNKNTPDLYPNNVHHSLGWIVTWIACAQALISLVGLYAKKFKNARNGESIEERTAFIPVSEEAMAEHHRTHPVPARGYRWSNDSGQGSEIISNSAAEERQLPDLREYRDDDEHVEEGEDAEKRGFLQNNAIDRFLSRRFPSLLSARALRLLFLVRSVIDRFILLLGFAALTSGAVTYGGIFRENDIFNGMAHFVKGGIFFWYGLLTLGRWMGCFADFGWAWNIKPPAALVGRRAFRAPSAEFVESFVIFLYGSTNVFMEHMAAWGHEWSAMDLEHVSISIMFFGGGLCGMLVESRKIRDLLNTTILSTRPAQFQSPFPGQAESQLDPAWEAPSSYRTSMNPLPGLVILLLGLMMSSHHQDSMVSSMVHKQWGTLLVGFSFARAATYILLYISPPSSLLPSRPPSEMIAAFCLISGGLMFMASNRNTVQAMEAYGLDAMFIFTVVMGFTLFLMALETIVIAIKGWAVRHEKGRTFSTFPSHPV